ncbi:hypothetical protein Barb6XT_01101 [Bacteroidales bacterium Barb6XT]|nr:hypothetical protein Barb6XT_01101 [Bacteroidales bacterium Barb6XT]
MGDTREVLQGRPNMYCVVNHHLRFVSPFQGFIGLYPSITPHSAPLHVGLKSGVLSGLLYRCHPITLTPQTLWED